MYPSDVVLQDKLVLYNNIGAVGDKTGRLTVELVIFPSPSVHWMFETILPVDSESICPSDVKDDGSITALGIELSQVGVTDFGFHEDYGKRIYRLYGVAGRALRGVSNLESNFVSFYLPNGRFHEEAFAGQHHLERNHHVHKDNKLVEDPSVTDLARIRHGKYFKEQIENFYLDILSDETALTWLNKRQHNYGTRITTECSISFKNSPDGSPFFVSRSDIENKLNNLCRLLSFANGGYTNPPTIVQNSC